MAQKSAAKSNDRPENQTDIQLKFDGPLISDFAGAPADAVINSLSALQRMVHLIGMKAEGRVFAQRVKPSARVRRDYAVICHAPKKGSHIQPLSVGGGSISSGAAAAARDKLLNTLKAFDSGDPAVLRQTIPNARERWFLAEAASGLLPQKDSGIEVTLRAGTRGPFAFKAERARSLIEEARSGRPPKPEQERIVGKLRAIDYSHTKMTLQPGSGRSVRISYPLRLEPMLQVNVRRRISLLGDPEVNSVGDIISFQIIDHISEVEPTLAAIDGFSSGDAIIISDRPLAIPISFDFTDRLFVYQNEELGIDAYSESFDQIRTAILDELDVLWRNYALAADEELAEDALIVKHNLIHRFRTKT